jgi:ring-1,2-phenylacetyl-CoA epoxidase subunit PaaC
MPANWGPRPAPRRSMKTSWPSCATNATTSTPRWSNCPTTWRAARDGRILRNAAVATWLRLAWTALAGSRDSELAAIAGKALKEARYHEQHAADWVVRLGDGTEESARRMQCAVDGLWRYLPEWFEDDEVDQQAAATGLGPAASALKPAFDDAMATLLAEAHLSTPQPSPFRSTGRRGVHSEHMGFLLAEMQHLQRAYPGGVW